jgi:hypothetical protein
LVERMRAPPASRPALACTVPQRARAPAVPAPRAARRSSPRAGAPSPHALPHPHCIPTRVGFPAADGWAVRVCPSTSLAPSLPGASARLMRGQPTWTSHGRARPFLLCLHPQCAQPTVALASTGDPASALAVSPASASLPRRSPRRKRGSNLEWPGNRWNRRH